MYGTMDEINNMIKTKTTVILPKDLVDRAKLKALQESTSLGKVISESLQRTLFGKTIKKAVSDPMKTLGVLKLGIKKLYKNRSELYEDRT